MEEEQDIVKRAYLAGYWVGYTGNSEWVGAGNRLKRGVLKAAEEAGLLREVLKAYREGKLHGLRTREREILERISSKLSSEETPDTVRHSKKALAVGFPEPASPSGRGIRSIEKVQMLRPTDAIRRGRLLLMPRFVRRG